MKLRYTWKRWVAGILIGIAVIVLLLFLWIITSLQDLRVFVPHYPGMTGMFGPEKRYLILLQNNEELRPTGGFITAYGFLEFAGGLPKSIEIADVYQLQGYRDENIRPMPAPMEFFFEDPFFRGYSFHDGNWSPDFPTAAQEVIRLYQEDENNVPIDGVIAVNFSVIEDMLDVYGGVRIEDTRFTKHNFFTLMEFEVNNMDRHNVEALQNRKNTLGLVQKALMKQAFGDIFAYPRTAGLLSKHLHEKNIQIWFQDKNHQKVVEANGWDGTMWKDQEPFPRDIFGVNVANLGAGKSDRYVEKFYDYDVRISSTPEGPKATARVVLRFKHLGDMNIPVSFDYRAWVRTYLPKGTRIVNGLDGATVESEFGHTVIGKMVRMAPGEVGTLVYDVELPDWILLDDNRYKLILPKQSSVDGHYAVSVHFPQGYELFSDDFEVRDNIALFDGELENDSEFSLVFEEDDMPPRVSLQRFDDLNRIIVQFNEPIDAGICDNPEAFILTDKNINVPEKDDGRISYREIECRGREIVFWTQGISIQREEHYSLVMEDIVDLSGNRTLPSPKEITLVQRY